MGSRLAKKARRTKGGRKMENCMIGRRVLRDKCRMHAAAEKVKKSGVGKSEKRGKGLDCSLTGAALVQLKNRRGAYDQVK
jgi:hypothetical protein